MNVASFRQQMPVAKRWAYFDHAAVAPLPSPSRVAMDGWLASVEDDGDVHWPEWAQRVEAIRRTASELLGAKPEEIAFVANTTTGIGLVAEGFPWREGDNVVTLANEFPSNAYPWLHLRDRGVETRRVAVDEAAVDWSRATAACDQRTRMLALSWVGYATGWRLDLEQVVSFAQARGIRVFLDAIQGLGVFPLNLSALPIDYLAADGHKWLLGPEGAGLLYVRHERLDELRTLGIGWHSMVQGHDFARIELNLRPDAARYEGGTQNVVGLVGLGASLDLLRSYGLRPTASPLAEQILQFTDEACRRIVHAGGRVVSARPTPAHCSGIVAFELPGLDPAAARKIMLQQGVVVSCRAGLLRLSPHAYCDHHDLARFSDALEACRKA